ncbi:hypothetical protein QVD17_09397 [Tagetes erecta]|uniref:Uncharacterized protein n=1 Tax=Tagetes erecta TaxID=13708 RepID=A0AAD8KZ88_TARER|nr:hypothetical protein QVD17_09397 [Tagetes erecta]
MHDFITDVRQENAPQEDNDNGEPMNTTETSGATNDELVELLKLADTELHPENNEADIIHGSTSSDLSLAADLDNLTFDGLSRDEAIEVNVSLEHVDVDVEPYEDTYDGEDSDADNTIDVIDDLDDDLLESNNECEMADVARGHGGDTFGRGPPGGGPPDGDRSWQMPRQCEVSDDSTSGSGNAIGMTNYCNFVYI